MNLRAPLELPIFFMNERISSLENAGIDYNVRESDIREVTFYSINAVSQYIENFEPSEFTNIYVDGDLFVCAWPVEDVKRKISLHI